MEVFSEYLADDLDGKMVELSANWIMQHKMMVVYPSEKSSWRRKWPQCNFSTTECLQW